MIGLVDDAAVREHFKALKGMSVTFHTSLLDLYEMPVIELYWLVGVA